MYIGSGATTEVVLIDGSEGSSPAAGDMYSSISRCGHSNILCICPKGGTRDRGTPQDDAWWEMFYILDKYID